MASIRSRKSELEIQQVKKAVEITKKSMKKIAFCFLIYETINNEEIWNQYFQSIDKDKYNIYIHYKKDKPLKYLNQYKINNPIPTSWGALSVVLAQNILLKTALKDPNNQHFVWLSGSCIPLKPFHYTYKYLDESKSYYNKSPDSQVFPRANKCSKYLQKEKVKKANMASIINRKHAQVFVDNEDQIKLWFKGIKNVDELTHLTLLWYFDLQNELVLTDNIAAGSIIFAQWSDQKNYKVFPQSQKENDYTYKSICEEELNYLKQSKSLFGRKFVDNCSGLETLLEFPPKDGKI